VKKNIVVLFSFLLFFISININAQTLTPVQDNANNGQLKRMVHIQWDDWQPTPAVNWLGIPKNLEGYIYWRILHRSYWKGEDSRPIRADGPYVENYASLFAQEMQDKNISDTTQAIMETNAATYLNMSGGSLDIPYNIFFKDKFNGIFNGIAEQLNIIQQRYPSVFNEMVITESFQNFLEYLDIVQDRIENIHQSFLDKGKRITTYLEILRELEYKKNVITKYISQFTFIATLPKQKEINAVGNQAIPPNNDAQIVQKILQTHKF
jgi:hypothetical protein